MPSPHEWIIRLSHSRELAWLRETDAGGVMKVGDMQNQEKGQSIMRETRWRDVDVFRLRDRDAGSRSACWPGIIINDGWGSHAVSVLETL